MERKPTEKQKRTGKVSLFAVTMYLLLIAVMLCGVSFSKYVAGTEGADTARVAGLRDITISETGNFTRPNQWIITPGVDMIKNATVRFEGSEMACYVFLRIRTTGWKQTDDYSFACSVDGHDALTWSVDETVWRFLAADDGDAVYYSIVRANAPFEAAVLASGGTITVSRNLTRTQLDKLTVNLAAELSIDMEATAMQYHGVEEVMNPGYDERERAKTAWDMVKVK